MSVAIAAGLWGPQWSGKHICFHSDNMAVVAMLQRRSAKPPPLMHLLRCVSLFSAFYCFHLSARHVPGVLNGVADAFSRNKAAHVSSLFHRYPNSNCLTGSTGCSSPRGHSVLDGIVRQLSDGGVAQSTKKVYESGQCRFLSFCSQFSLNPLPASEAVLCRFVAFLAASNITYGSVRSYLSAVRHFHIMNNLPDPSLSSFPQLE